jgi:hypothetical protein
VVKIIETIVDKGLQRTVSRWLFTALLVAHNQLPDITESANLTQVNIKLFILNKLIVE